MRRGRSSGTATVLFTDLVGSTDLMAQVGEAAFDELRGSHFAALRGAIESAGGEEIKNTGDGLMAVFASVVDAIHCAVAMQQATDRQARAGPTPLAIRVGISVGEVTFEDNDVFGTPVVEAARLVAAAATGQILTTTITRVLAGSRVEAALVDVGALTLKGLPEPVSVCEVAWEPLPEPSVPMPTLLTDVGRIFVGREDELERLQQLWKEAAAGERRVALIAGEPGIGKTRLTAELAVRVHDDGAIVLAGRCDEDLGVPFQPFVEALRHYVTRAGEPRLGRYAEELTRLMPELPKVVGGLPEPLRSDPETERYRLFDAIAAWLSDVSAEAPVLLVLDDLHWAAKPTLLLLRHVLRSPEPLRLLVVATYRDSDIGRTHPLSDLLAELRRDGGVERLALSGLDTPAVTAFIESAAGHSLDDEESQELPRVVWRETEGNPFFVSEVLRHLSESRAIEERDGRWVLNAAVGELGIPEGVRDVVGRRLSRLADSTNRVLAIGAVVGLEFEPAVVERVAGVEEEEFLAALDEATHSRLLEEVPGARYRFAHALVRATLYEELTAARRVALHRRVAGAIESLHGHALDDHLPALAHHWARASAPAADADRAIDYATRAGDRALAQLAHDEAVTYYRQALALLGVTDGASAGQRTGLLIALGEAERRAGDTAHRETLLEACRLAAEQGDGDALARAALASARGIYSSLVGGVDDERVRVLEDALEARGRDGSPTRARLLAALALELGYAGDWERRVGLADEALAIARRSGDTATLAHVLLQRFFTLYVPDTLEDRLANTEELLPLADQMGDPNIAARALLLRFRVLFEVGDVDGADRNLQAAELLAQELGEQSLRWMVGLNRTARIILAGDLEEGERRAHELGRATGQRDNDLYRTALLFQVRYDQGRLGEMEELLADTAAAFGGLSALRLYQALLFCELGRPEEAAEYYEPLAVTDFTALARDTGWGLAMMHCSAVCAHLGDRARAPVLFDLLAPYADQIVFTSAGALGAIAHHLAVLATISGDYAEAERCFTAAAATHERIPAPTWLARTRLEWARMLLARRRPGDTERARGFLDQALATAREFGLANIERQAVTLLQ